MTRKLLSNIPLKLMSVVAAVLVWLLVVNIDDPIVSTTIQNINVDIRNESYVESAGLMCLLDGEQNVIDVRIRGKRSVVRNISVADIQAVADLTQIVDMKTTPVMVPVSVSCSGISGENIVADPQYISIHLDDMMSQEFLINPSAGETTPAKGYEVGSLQCSSEKVKITGPQSLIQKIDKVTANVDVTNMSEDTTVTSDLKITDKNQDVLSAQQMQYLKYDIVTPKINVMVKLWKVQNDVKLKAEYSGEPAVGYKIGGITLTPGEVSVAGSTEALAALADAGNTITIPAEKIDVSGKKADFEVKLNLADFLLENTKLTTGNDGTVLASVAVLEQDTQEYAISATNIEAQNVEAGMQVVYETAGVQVRVREDGKDLENLKVSDIKASIDFKGKPSGTYSMPVKISLPEGYTVADEVKIVVKIVADDNSESAE